MVASKPPFVRVVRAGWPETLQATLYALGEAQEFAYAGNLEGGIEVFAKEVARYLEKEQGIRVGPWEPAGPCVMEAQIL